MAHFFHPFFCSPSRSAATWVRELVQDSDVESNPGPATPLLSFQEFLKEEYDLFAPHIPPVDLAKHAGLLRTRLRHSSENLQDTVDQLASVFGPSLNGQELLSL